MGFFKLTVRDVPLAGKTVLVRADYNVPLNKAGEIDDDLRIRASVPTLRYLIDKGCTVVVMSHLGRPEGRDAALSLEPIAARLSEVLGEPVAFVEDVKGDKVLQAVKRAKSSSVTLLENLRYYPEEEANDDAFAAAIAKATGARYFVQDGFGVVHRAHASTDAITHHIPSVAGLLLEKEYRTITDAMEHPHRPLVAILGGAKVSDKIKVIERFVAVADKIIIGGAMANTFLSYRGISVGSSKVESDQSEVLDRIYAAAHQKVGDNVDEFLLLPSDVAEADNPDESASRQVVSIEAIENHEKALDIGDATIERYVAALEGAHTVVWNGTMGFAELPAFAHGSARIAMALATADELTSIIGGGDTADFALKWDGNGGASFTHVSTGGGASLELMSGEKLPGVERLLNAQK